MFIEEAQWLGEAIATISPSAVFPLLDLGSGSEELRKRKRPWIHENLFRKAEEGGYDVVHSDIEDATGVDVVGDLTDQQFQKVLLAKRFDSVLCSNLLEHLPNRDEVATLVSSLIPGGGYIFASCPYVYPYHPSPIDTLYRPTVQELADLFPSTVLLHGNTVTGDT